MWDSLPGTKAWSWGDLMREILETPTIAEMADKIETKEKEIMRRLLLSLKGHLKAGLFM